MTSDLPGLGSPLKVIVIGNTLLTKKCVETLADSSSYDISCVIQTLDDFSADFNFVNLHSLCLKKGIPYRYHQKLTDPSFKSIIKRYRADLVLLLGYTGAVPEILASHFQYGCVSVFEGLLPHFSGHDPIAWAILKDLAETGVTLYRVVPREIHGDIILQQTVPIETGDDASALHKKITDSVCDLLQTLPFELCFSAEEPRTKFSVQDIKQYWRLLSDQDRQILDWSLPCDDILRIIRGCTRPFEGAWCIMEGQKLTIWRAVKGKFKSDLPPGKTVYQDEDHLVITTGTLDLDILVFDSTPVRI